MVPHIAEMVLKGMVPSYKDLVYINDFRMLLGTWLEDLYFPAARAQMAVSGHLEAVLSGLPDAPALRDARERLFPAGAGKTGIPPCAPVFMICCWAWPGMT